MSKSSLDFAIRGSTAKYNRIGYLASSSSAPFAGIAASLGLWWLGTIGMIEPDSMLRNFAPDACWQALIQMFETGEILPHIQISLQRVVLSLLLALLIGLPLGILVGLSARLEQTTGAVFQFIRMISPISWMPLAVMLFGIGDAPVIFLLTIAAIWPVMLNVSAGVHAVDPYWLTLARSLCATRWETVSRIIIPAIIAHTLTGIRLAIGVIWIVLVPAEMLGVSAGLGYFILDTRDRLAYSELMAVILIIGLIGYLLDGAARFLIQHRTHRRIHRRDSA